MAVWGAPVAREDDAERAVRAGLDLVDAVMVLGPGIQARAGVLTGEAAVTIGATNQGMVAGDLVNTASRLQSVAVPGTVLVGEATHRAASMAIAFEEAGDQVLKGKASPVPAWRALRVVSERGGRNRSETLEAPFVGRDDELRQLKDQFHATSRDGRARLVSVIGAAGIGKNPPSWGVLQDPPPTARTPPHHRRWRARSCSRSAGTGAHANAPARPCISSRCPSRRCASCSLAWCRVYPQRQSRRSSPAPMGCPCTPSRRSGCSSPRVGSRSTTASTDQSAIWSTWRSRRR